MSADPYASLEAHVIQAKALYCEDGCGLVETSGYGDDDQAAKELASFGWAVRPHSMGGLTSLCRDCVREYDQEHGDAAAAESDVSSSVSHAGTATQQRGDSAS